MVERSLRRRIRTTCGTGRFSIRSHRTRSLSPTMRTRRRSLSRQRGYSINLASCLTAKADFSPRPSGVYRRALAIDEKSYGPDHPDVAARVGNFANLLRGDWTVLLKPSPSLRHALATRRGQPRAGSPLCSDWPQQSGPAATGYESPRRSRTAHAPRACDRRDKSMAPNHPNVGIRLSDNLASCLLQATGPTSRAPSR